MTTTTRPPRPIEIANLATAPTIKSSLHDALYLGLHPWLQCQEDMAAGSACFIGSILSGEGDGLGGSVSVLDEGGFGSVWDECESALFTPHHRHEYPGNTV